MCAAAKGYSLHIGLNYVDPVHYQGWDGKLKACEADADDMEALARDTGYETRKLIGNRATRDAMIDGIRAAAGALAAGDIFLLTISSHGGQIPNVAGGDVEPDGMDETLCLYDGQLIDDELELLWRQFVPGVRILMVSDSCNSETVARFAPPTGVTGPAQERAAVRATPDAVQRRVYLANRAFYTGIQIATNAALNRDRAPPAYTVRLLAGCQDGTSSYDGPENGAFTAALLKAWNYGRFSGDYRKLYDEIVRRLREAQVPQLQFPQHNVFGRPNPVFDAQRPFSITGSAARAGIAPRTFSAMNALAPGGLDQDATEAIERYLAGHLPGEENEVWSEHKPGSDLGMDSDGWLGAGQDIILTFNGLHPTGPQIDPGDGDIKDAISFYFDRPLGEFHQYLVDTAGGMRLAARLQMLQLTVGAGR